MKKKKDYKRGDVILVIFPDSNLITAKPRPTLIIQSDDLNTGLSQTVVAMITSQMHRAGHPSRIPVLLSTSEGRQSGLITDSVVMTDNLTTILDSEIDRAIGCLPMDKINRALRHTLNL